MKKVLLITTLGLFTLTANANNVGDDNKLADKDRQNSMFFKMSRNSNRIVVFEQLQSLVKIKSPRPNYAAIKGVSESYYSTIDDIIEILGEPNVRFKNNSFVYTLNPSTGCKAIVEFDANKTVVYLGVKDCN